MYDKLLYNLSFCADAHALNALESITRVTWDMLLAFQETDLKVEVQRIPYVGTTIMALGL